jgi:hypothetical protein
MMGYVYLIGTTVFRWYKIGKSRTPTVRINDLGILLPFKIRVLGVWKAVDHDSLERELHDKYAYCRINGEWFSFENQEIQNLFTLLPESARVFPKDDLKSVFFTFSNIEEDRRKGRKIIGVRVQKLRGNFTPKEREERRIASIKLQQLKKLEKLKLTDNPLPTDVKNGASVSEPLQGEQHDVSREICSCNKN